MKDNENIKENNGDELKDIIRERWTSTYLIDISQTINKQTHCKTQWLILIQYYKTKIFKWQDWWLAIFTIK